MIIGITGKKQSGKDTVADYIIYKYPSFTRYRFADPLKNIICYLTGWNIPDLENSEFKEAVDSKWGFSPRYALQQIGTEGFRKLLRDDFWVKVAEKYVIPKMDYVISDIRFEDEAKFVRKRKGKIIHLRRFIAGLSVDKHLSEKGIAFKNNDIMITNDKTKEDLYKDIDSIMA